MTDPTHPSARAIVDGLRGLYADGLSLADVPRAVGLIAAAAPISRDRGVRRRALVLEALELLVDETDTPWVDDATWDPIAKRFLPGLVDLALGALDSSVTPQAPSVLASYSAEAARDVARGAS